MCEEKKIRKVINYCWFGGNEKPQKVIECIDSWKKICKDYEIVEWNESNFDIKKYKFVEEAYRAQKWAFVTDVARLDIIYNNGGIYFDTDVEVVRNIDDLLKYDLFMGFESREFLNDGLGFGAIKNNDLLRQNLEEYKSVEFDEKNLSSIACPIITSRVFEKNGFLMNNTNQVINNNAIFSKEYFCPMDYETGKIDITDKTYSIHHYSASWKSKIELRMHKTEQNLFNLLNKMYSGKNNLKIAHRISKLIWYVPSLLENKKGKK
ncbi:MAG: glycosyl transferase [Clostridia bacterium]|nr:glycosyl transferase [Clostridia bacterium]